MKRNNPGSALPGDPRQRLGQLLLKQQLIDQTQLRQALDCQRQSDQRLGEILVKLGYISQQTLKRTLSKQRWLRPCAACFALMSPFSDCFASDDPHADIQPWSQTSHWSYSAYERVGASSSSQDIMKFAAEAAWDIYQGEPQKGEWRYSLSVPQQDSYSLELTMRF
ncbi:hypothetical protein [Bacterioplanoides sp.]|uniref:hypothetical protein n=1 Tax=Bacterioplanoides sp. TaxID=2066072 RepID=UPI003B5976DD